MTRKKRHIQLLEAVVKVEWKNFFLSQLDLNFWIYNLPYFSQFRNWILWHFMTRKKWHIVMEVIWQSITEDGLVNIEAERLVLKCF